MGNRCVDFHLGNSDVTRADRIRVNREDIKRAAVETVDLTRSWMKAHWDFQNGLIQEATLMS